MSRILVPSTGAESWRPLVAKPDLHWVTGYSARTLAHAWEAADGVPPEVQRLMVAAFGSCELLFAIPEHKTALPGGRRDSQSDVFALVRHDEGLATYTIEGKVDEPFGPTVGEWSRDQSPGKRERLGYILGLLGIESCPPEVRYQLLHRTASALIEASRFAADKAGMIVHSFSAEGRWFEEFARFVSLFGRDITPGSTATIIAPAGKQLMLGWCSGQQEFRTR